MSVEDRVTTALRQSLDRLEVSPGNPSAALADGDSVRRRRRATRVVAAAAAVAAVAVVGAVVTGGDGALEPAPAPAGSWTELPTPPLSPRTGSIAVWTGSKAIFVGGQTDAFCPPNADCAVPPTYARDGAAYDPSTKKWTSIAPAPAAVAYYTPHVLVDGLLVIVDDDHAWHAYDPEQDAWQPLPNPPTRTEYNSESLSATGGSVYTLGKGGEVLVLDIAGKAWSTLPPSTTQPRLENSVLQATPEGVVKIGVDATARNDGTEPSYLIADVYRDGAWHRAERSNMTGGYTWHWTGERLVSPTPTCVDGGEVNPFPRCIPEGGIFDPATGRWDELPQAPESPASTHWSLNANGGPWMLSYGFLYDDADGSWTVMGTPKGSGELMDTSSVVAGSTVIAFGGVDWSRGMEADDLATNQAWQWSP